MWKHIVYNPATDDLAAIIKEHTGDFMTVLRWTVPVSEQIVLIFGPPPLPPFIAGAMPGYVVPPPYPHSYPPVTTWKADRNSG